MSELHTQLFNRPPRTRRIPATVSIRLPNVPSFQRRGIQSLTPILSSVTLIIASAVVANVAGRSLLYLVPMVAASAIFMLIAVVQMVGSAVQARKEMSRYRTEMRIAIAELISAHGEQQYIRCFNDPPPTLDATTNLLNQLRTEQEEQIANYLRPLAKRNTTDSDLYPPSLWHFPTHEGEQAYALPSILNIAGCCSPNQRRTPLARLWERRPIDPDFLEVRFGQGESPSATIIQQPNSRNLPPEHQQLEMAFHSLAYVPLTCSLPTIGSLGIAGDDQQRLKLAQTLIWQLVTHHAPTDVRIAAVYNQSNAWSWMKWLPHTIPLNGDRNRRMLAATPRQHEQLLVSLLNELSRRREMTNEEELSAALVVLIDAEAALYREPAVRDLLRFGSAQRIYVLVLAQDWQRLPSNCGAMIRFSDDIYGQYASAAQSWSQTITLDQADPAQSERLARTLAPFGGSDVSGNQELPQTVRLIDLLAPLDGAELNCLEQWKQIPARAWHQRVPIGQEASGQPRYLDLNEHSDGPHGIIAGKTGAGKSELLQAMIASIALTHAPDRAQFFLIDFKGGASLRMFSTLPHTAGFVTDLQDSRLAERAIVALKRELRRRKDILNEADVKDITSYRAVLEPLAPLANLLVVIDEFDAMVTNQPSFVTELVSVVKQGRSLGVHLLLATQQPSVAVKEEIKTQLQYWIALRLGSSQDSREMLQRPDAVFLPSSVPGRAYMRVGTALTLFQAARVSALYQPTGNETGASIFEIDETGQVVPIDTLPSTHIASTSQREQAALTDLDVIVRHIKDAGQNYGFTAMPIWCPPLSTELLLQTVLDTDVIKIRSRLLNDHERFEWPQKERIERLLLPFGIIDLPEESIQLSTAIDFSQGHVLVIGASGSGKTMLLRTMLMSIALMCRPDQLWCYVIDAGGQGLQAFRDLPHVGGIIGVRDVEGVRRLMWMLQQQIKQRSSAMNDQQSEAEVPSDQPTIVFVIDKFLLFRQEYEQFNLIDDLVTLASQGRAYKIHLVITADRPGDVPFRLQGLLDTRMILRMADDNDSLTFMGRRDAASIPAQRAGRGYRLTQEHGWAEVQVALPYIGTEESLPTNVLETELVAETRRLAQLLAKAWAAQPGLQQIRPPRIQLLPSHVSLQHVIDRSNSLAVSLQQRVRVAVVGTEGYALGDAEVTLGPRYPALLITGGPRAGKTNTLHTIVRSLAARYKPTQLRFALVDPRGSSFAQLQIPHHKPLYASGETELVALTQHLTETLTTPHAETHWIVIVDDFDLGASLLVSQFSKPYGANAPRNFFQLLEWIASKGREYSCSMIMATQSTTPTGLLSMLNAGRNGFIMRPHEYPPATNLLGIKLPVPLVGQACPGRALQVIDGVQRWVQIADAVLDEGEQI